MHCVKDLLWHASLPSLDCSVEHLVACCLGSPLGYTVLLCIFKRSPLKQLMLQPGSWQAWPCSGGRTQLHSAFLHSA